MYYCTQQNDVSLAKKIQNNLPKYHRKHGVIDQVKYRKIASKIICTYIEYHVQDNADVAHKDFKMYFDTN